MEIEEVKTWQWVLAGLIVGLAFSAIVAWTGPTFDTQARDTIEQGEFENNAFALSKFGQINGLVQKYHTDDKTKKTLPILSDVTVHPPVDSDPQHRYWVTGRAYFVGYKPKDPTNPASARLTYYDWVPFKYPASAPYKPAYTVSEEKKLDRDPNRNRQMAALKSALGGASAFPTVNEYLKAVSLLPGNSLKYQYAWWELPVPKWTLPPLAGLLMIGIAWPLALGVLQNFGMAKAPPVRKVASPKALPPVPVRKPMKAAGVSAPAIQASPQPKAAPQGENKKYGGEFYPVVKTTHKD